MAANGNAFFAPKNKIPNGLHLEQSEASTHNYSGTEIEFKPFCDDT
jgi:hypothetical protein